MGRGGQGSRILVRLPKTSVGGTEVIEVEVAGRRPSMEQAVEAVARKKKVPAAVVPASLDPI